MIEVLEIGTEVIIRDKVKAHISAIQIRDNNNICYECVWWNGSQRFEVWLNQFEITSINETKSRILGFRS
jgi:hypothetical protein